MPTFILSLNWTDQGIRAVKDAPKRSQAARELAKKLGVEVKQLYLTSGENDLLERIPVMWKHSLHAGSNYRTLAN
jgi:uncharacterized protein with GYD domain